MSPIHSCVELSALRSQKTRRSFTVRAMGAALTRGASRPVGQRRGLLQQLDDPRGPRTTRARARTTALVRKSPAADRAASREAQGQRPGTGAGPAEPRRVSTSDQPLVINASRQVSPKWQIAFSVRHTLRAINSSSPTNSRHSHPSGCVQSWQVVPARLCVAETNSRAAWPCRASRRDGASAAS
jgi:hypothetical protein